MADQNNSASGRGKFNFSRWAWWKTSGPFSGNFSNDHFFLFHTPIILIIAILPILIPEESIGKRFLSNSLATNIPPLLIHGCR